MIGIYGVGFKGRLPNKVIVDSFGNDDGLHAKMSVL